MSRAVVVLLIFVLLGVVGILVARHGSPAYTYDLGNGNVVYSTSPLQVACSPDGKHCEVS